jgi:hypothetical protein
MKNRTGLLPDIDSIRLIPKTKWKVKGTIHNATKTTPLGYKKQFSKWVARVRKDVLKTDASLLWFWRLENKDTLNVGGVRWHLHFILGGDNLALEIAQGDKFFRALEKVWPVKCNAKIEAYVIEHPSNANWNEYINKPSPYDANETHTKFSPILVKEVRRIRRRMALETKEEAKKKEMFVF